MPFAIVFIIGAVIIFVIGSYLSGQRKEVINYLRERGAISEETAVVIPDEIKNKYGLVLVSTSTAIHQTKDGKFWTSV